MNNCKLLIILFCFFSNLVFSSDYIWPKYTPIVVPDSLKTEDAFFISKWTTYDFKDSYETTIIYFNRIYINTKKGVEDYSTMELPIYSSDFIEMIQARIIKPSGEIVEIKKENIKETYITGKVKYSKKTLKRIQFLFPDLHEGDVIDLVYKTGYRYYISSEMLYLESNIPSLYSKIVIRNWSELEIAIFSVNNNANYKSEEQIYTWEKNGVGVRQNDGFNAFKSKTPRFYYSLISPKHNLSYGLVYSLDTDDYPVKKDFGMFKFTKKLNDLNVYSQEDSALVKINKIINVIKEFNWISNSERNNNISNIDYFDQKRINENLFFKYLQNYFDENNIIYNRCFTNSLLDGPFEKNILSYTQFSYRFLTVKDHLGNHHYIFPPDNDSKFYNLDEIPYYCEGNNSILMTGNDLTLKDITDVYLPESQVSENKHSFQIRMKVEVGDSIKIKYSRKDLLSGQFSNFMREKDSESWLESFGIADTVIPFFKEQKTYPYEVELKQDSLSVNCFEDIEDSLYWLNSGHFIPENVFGEYVENIELGNYLVLPFKQMKVFSIYIENEKGIKCEEKETLISNVNSLGEITAKCVSVSPTIMKVEYTMKLKERIVDGDEKVKEYKDFLSKWKEIRNKKWILKMG